MVSLQLILWCNMYLLKETTVWQDGTSSKANGVYIFETKPKTRMAKAVGYINNLTDEAKWFTKPLDIDMKNRTFVEVGKSK